MTDHPLMEHTGYGLIETMRVRAGRIPLLERHLARLERSLRELGLPRPSRDVAALVRPFSGAGEAVLRVDVCDGRATVTVRELPALDPPVVITASEPHQPYPHKTTDRDAFADAAVEAEVAEADAALLLTHEGWEQRVVRFRDFGLHGRIGERVAVGRLVGIGLVRLGRGDHHGRVERGQLA